MIYNLQQKNINHVWNLDDFINLNLNQKKLIFREINTCLESLDAKDRVNWALKYLPTTQSILSSSFGAYSSVILHLITQYYPKIPIILIDTGYLFPETYRFIDRLTKKLNLNLQVFRAIQSSAWQESKYGKLWEQGIEGITQYNLINKIQPMLYAINKLNISVWFAGLRRSQSNSRKKLSIINIQNQVFKFLPIVDWSDDQIHQYMHQHNLEYHPLWYKGYVSIGDVHTTRKKEPHMQDEDTRFFGLKRECGLHHID